MMNFSFYQRWIFACTAAELVGIGAATLTALLINAFAGEPVSTAGCLGVLGAFATVGAIEGGALAGFQWRVLRSRLPRLRAGEWATPTIALAVTGWIAGMVPSLFAQQDSAQQPETGLGVVMLMAAMAGAGAGLCFGAAQWFVLRRHAERSQRWIWIHVPAWALAMAAIFLGASLPASGSSAWVIGTSGAAGGLLAGVLLGATTGLVARSLRPWVDERARALSGKVAIVTGANSGLGEAISLGLARLGATVVLLCRRREKGDGVRAMILRDCPSADVSVVACDLSVLESVRAAAARLLAEQPRIDILVHNAGATFPKRALTVDGIESTLAVDAIGPFLLTRLLGSRLQEAPGRVISLTGIYHRRGRLDLTDVQFERRPYSWLDANNQAQKARFLLASAFARRAPGASFFAVHPGAVLTGAQAHLPAFARLLIWTVMRPAFVRAEVGAIPVLRLAVHPAVPPFNGRFFNRCRVTPDVADPELADALWNACETLANRSVASSRRQLSAV